MVADKKGIQLENLTFHDLHPDSAEDINDLQKVLMAAVDYYLLVEGKSPGPDAAMEVLQELPPGKLQSDKYVYGIQYSGKLIGCFDLVRAYSNPETAFIGLLLLVESEQRKSYGVKALEYIERLAGQWGCICLRIAVIENNRRALAFWAREGFSELYRKPSNRYIGDAIIMERNLLIR
jgi:GNAT superfamily N-acetyltransferase